MKQNFTRLIVAAFLLITAHSGFSQVSENFNTRPGALNGADIKSHLMSKGWEFNSANVSMTSVLEGDASVETSALSPFGNHGIISPLLKVEGNSITVGFTYQYKNGNGGNHTFYIHLVNCAGDWIQMLGSATTPDISTPSSFSQTFGGITPGEYRVFINFQGMGMANAVIDDVNISGPMRYVNGVNTAPVGVEDFFNGLPNFTASGNVLANDSDVDSETVLSANLYTAPPAEHGTVVLNADGSFTFTPADGFTGSGTSFQYTVCDDGTCAPLCSDPVTVIINFPVGAPMPVLMLDFTATLQTSTVLLNWSTTSEVNNARFEVERSVNGTVFTKIGEVAGRGTVATISDYTFNDNSLPSGATHLFYRLKQVDIDGKFEYTKTVVVRLEGSASPNVVTVSPNPFVSQVRLNIDLLRTSSITVRVLDNSSREVLRKTMKGYAGSNSFTIEEVSRLNKGMYFVEILINNQERIVNKLIKN